MSAEIAIDQIPGHASQVWGGWVWMNGSTEYRWSKRRTRDECEAVVLHACQRVGIDRAMDPEEAA